MAGARALRYRASPPPDRAAREGECLVRLRLFGRRGGAGRGLLGAVGLLAEGLHTLAQLTQDVRELSCPEHDEHDHENEDELRAPKVERHSSLPRAPQRAC